jgi:hypothetical protein
MRGDALYFRYMNAMRQFDPVTRYAGASWREMDRDPIDAGAGLCVSRNRGSEWATREGCPSLLAAEISVVAQTDAYRENELKLKTSLPILFLSHSAFSSCQR